MGMDKCFNALPVVDLPFHPYGIILVKYHAVMLYGLVTDYGAYQLS